jgi:nicotinamide mononucleotide transporter
MLELLETLYQYFAANQFELWGTLFGIACVYLNTQNNIWGWPAGIVSVSIYLYVFWEARLYGDFLLQGVYVVLGFYGWYHWLYGGASVRVLPLSRLPRERALPALLGGVLATGALGAYFHFRTDNDFPFADATTTVFSLLAQWMLTQKQLENWLLWIFVDAICVVVYYQKALYITTFLYAVFLVLAAMGYWEWKRRLEATA